MNIRKLQFTDNLGEQITYGKELEEIYDDKMKKYVHSSIDRYANYEVLDIGREELYYKAIYDYWAYGFSPEQQIYFRLIGKSHDEKSSYLTFRNKFLYFDKLNDVSLMHILEDKYEAYQLLKPYYKRDVIKIKTQEDYRVFLKFIDKHPRFIVKPLGLSAGMGVRLVDSSNNNDIKQLFNSLISVGQSYIDNYSVKRSDHTAAVLEELIDQHESFSNLHPQSVQGVRLTTIRINSDVIVYYPWMKTGAHNNQIASPEQDAFDVGINVLTGEFETNGFFDDGTDISVHPDTKVLLKGYKIPKWSDAVGLAKELALQMPEGINYVGWDLVLTKDKGWVLMEGNYYGDVMWQMIWGKGMRSEFEEMIGWKMDKKFWWQYKQLFK